MAWKPSPTFRICGHVGCYIALTILFMGGLLAGRSLLVLATLAAVSSGTFLGWTRLRLRITGNENLVQLEHAWLAVATSAGVLWLFALPPLAYLDVVAPALCGFLAAGRVGCLLVGCCHGRPSSLGIRYSDELVRDGFQPELVGIRLFPVQLIDALGLAGIACSGLAMLATARPGLVFTWCAAAYSVIRFGLEGLRGDDRPHKLGLSISRWMCIAQLALAFGFDAAVVTPLRADLMVALAALLASVLIVVLLVARRYNQSQRLMSRAHVNEISDLVEREMALASESPPGSPPLISRTTLGVAAAVSSVPGKGAYHVSISLPDQVEDLPLLSRIVAASLPGADATSFVRGERGVVHCVVRPTGAPGASETNWLAFYARAVKKSTSSEHLIPRPADRKGATYFKR